MGCRRSVPNEDDAAGKRTLGTVGVPPSYICHRSFRHVSHVPYVIAVGDCSMPLRCTWDPECAGCLPSGQRSQTPELDEEAQPSVAVRF